jgi:hypothetical protein
MREIPWLFFGAIIGAIGGCVLPPSMGYHHGSEAEAWELLRPVYGASFGLSVGLAVDLYLRQRRKRP